MNKFNIKISLNGSIDTDFILNEDIEYRRYNIISNEHYCIYEFFDEDNHLKKSYQVPNHQLCVITQVDK